MPEPSPSLKRVTEQIAWYDRAATRSQRNFRVLKLAEIAIAAAIPVTVALDVSTSVAAVLGAVLVVFAGVQELYGFQKNWTSYRTTCEALRRELHLYEARAGQYAADNPDALFALAIESHMSQELSKWSESAPNPQGQPV